MVYVNNHNMITMAMVIFKTFKMADKGEGRVLTKILVYSCFIEPFICLLDTMNSQGPEEMCLSLEHQNASKTSEKMGYFDRVTVSLHILYTANQETEGSQDRLTI